VSAVRIAAIVVGLAVVAGALMREYRRSPRRGALLTLLAVGLGAIGYALVTVVLE
jgi:hypothetical protein